MARSIAARYLGHHGRFYGALALGLAVFAVMRATGLRAATVAAGDAFFLCYLVSSFVLIARQSGPQLRARAEKEDEGALLVFCITLGVVALACFGIFTALHTGVSRIGTVPFVLALAGPVLAWTVLHLVMAFHYANLFYVDARNDKTALDFPGGGKHPPMADFIYFSSVVGMTAQVSDVQVTTPLMRKAVTRHAIVSFFFNTVLLAMAVNAVIAAAQ